MLRDLMVESRKGSRKKPSGTPGGHIVVSCDDHPTHHGFSGWIGNSAGNTPKSRKVANPLVKRTAS